MGSSTFRLAKELKNDLQGGLPIRCLKLTNDSQILCALGTKDNKIKKTV